MDKQNKAALYALAGGVIWSFSGLLSRLVSWNSFSLVALRALVATVILGLCRGSFRIRPNKGLWLCGLGISATSLLYMSALRFTSTANAIVLQYTASVFVILYMLLVKRQKPLKSELIATIFVILAVFSYFVDKEERQRFDSHIKELFFLLKVREDGFSNLNSAHVFFGYITHNFAGFDYLSVCKGYCSTKRVNLGYGVALVLLHFLRNIV